jgi:hypothetical protein
VNPVVDARYPLSRINEAFKHFGEAHTGVLFGNICHS